MPDMLLEAVRARAEKQTEFGYGIMTADRYVKNMQDFVGLDICYDYASTRQMSFDDAMQKARKTLVYSNPDMVVLEKAKSASLEGITLPKNTLMVFKHVLTTPRKDRDGDILRTEGAMPDPRMLLLWQHVHTLPIGKMLAITEHNSKRLTLLSCIVDMNELSHDAAVMVDNDMARFSHGFRALEFNQMKENEGGATGAPGYEVTKFEILEESIVSVPSNADAEVEEVMMGLISTGKLTSPLMKEYGRAIRSRMPVMIASGISLNKGSEDGEVAEESADSASEETHATGEQAGDGTEKDGTSVPEVELVVEISAVAVETSATVEVKSGRKLSSANAKLLQDCVDDLQSCVDNDKDMSRGSQAICERCVNRLNKVMGSAESSDEGKTAPVTVAEPAVLTTKEAMTLFLTKSSESEQRQMFGVLQTLLNVTEKSRQVQEFKSFLGK